MEPHMDNWVRDPDGTVSEDQYSYRTRLTMSHCNNHSTRVKIDEYGDYEYLHFIFRIIFTYFLFFILFLSPLLLL